MRRLARASLLAALVGCHHASAPDDDLPRTLALVDQRYSVQPAVWVPMTARVGVPIGVDVAIVVGEACDRFVDADVSVTGLVATVTPYVVPNASVCERSGPFDVRRFPVRFDQAGDAVVRVRVRTADQGGAEVVLERAMTVTR